VVSGILTPRAVPAGVAATGAAAGLVGPAIAAAVAQETAPVDPAATGLATRHDTGSDTGIDTGHQTERAASSARVIHARPTDAAALPDASASIIPAPCTDAAASIWALLRDVPDPEIPAVSICDLGIVREVRMGEVVEVVLTPTYAGCPATHVIEQSVRDALHAHGYVEARVTITLAPPWTTDWISAAGRAKLLAYGIAPPGAARAGAAQVMRFQARRPGKADALAGNAAAGHAVAAPNGFADAITDANAADGTKIDASGGAGDYVPAQAEAPPACPQCGSAHTELLSQFGSTACKALYRCVDCREPFDYFKPY